MYNYFGYLLNFLNDLKFPTQSCYCRLSEMFLLAIVIRSDYDVVNESVSAACSNVRL